MPAGKIADQRADALAIGIAEPGERLVQQQQMWVGGKRNRNLEQPLLAMCEVGAARARTLGQPDAGEQRPDLFIDAGKTVGIAPERGAERRARLHRDAHRLEYGEVAEHAHDLERTGNPRIDPRNRRPGGASGSLCAGRSADRARRVGARLTRARGIGESKPNAALPVIDEALITYVRRQNHQDERDQ